MVDKATEKAMYTSLGVKFDVGPRYEPLSVLGKGTYGAVISAHDTKTKKKVAIKRLNALEDSIDAKRILREILILKNAKHENILGMVDILYKDVEDQLFGDIYLITEALDTDLHRILKSKQPLTDKHSQYFLYQILRGMHYLHTANIIHRDLKPSNILARGNCDIKMCDFGLARSYEEETHNADGNLTEYVVTRYYRAPEIMLNSHEYTKAVDMWSIGCTFAEVLNRKLLFPGEHYIKQIKLIVNFCGSPADDFIQKIKNENARQFLRSLPPTDKVDMKAKFPAAAELALDLLDKMLTFDPEERISVEEALKHPYLASLHDPNDEPAGDKDFQPFTFENQEISLAELEKLILIEVKDYNPDVEEYIQKIEATIASEKK